MTGVLMVVIPHVLVGIAIATKTGNPALALPLAFLSHFVLDLLPHWNPHIYTEIKKFGHLQPRTVSIIVLDSAIALLLGLFFASRHLPDTAMALTILLGAFFAILPDLLEAPYYFLRTRHPLMIKVVEFEHSLQGSAPFVPGVLIQVVIAAAALWWILV